MVLENDRSIMYHVIHMKIYPIGMTIVAVLAITAAGYFYWRDAGVFGQMEACQKDKALAENQLHVANEQLTRMTKTIAAFKAVNGSFMIPGDVKALSIGSQETADVEQKIGEMMDKQDRMGAETDWNDFKTSRRLNALFSLFRNFANNLERTLEQPK